MKKYVIGFDGGTGGVRAALYDRNGVEIAYSSTEYKTYYPHAGWAEQHPQDWWDAFGKCSKHLLESAKVSPYEIAAISYDVTSCSVLISDLEGEPLRPSLIWMDVRSKQEADDIKSTKHPILRLSGTNTVSAEWMPCKALWLKRNERDLYDKADIVCEYADWITFKLIGKWNGNKNNAATRWYYDDLNGGFQRDFFDAIDLSDVLEKFPPINSHLGDNVGTLTETAATHLGLTTDTIVGQGGIDAFIGNLGLGMVKPGIVSLITGSSHLITGLVEQENYRYDSNGIFGPFPNNLIEGLGMVEGGQTSSGSIISWFVKNFCQEFKSTEEAFEVLNEEASKLPPGSDNLMVLDWWQGNRTPYTDSEIRGTITGLSLKHTRAHIYRAIMEGIAYGTENVFESFRKSGYEVNEVYLGGGSANSDLFMQIHADISNVKIHVPENPQVMTLGAAMLAALAAGWYKDIEEAVEHMVRFSKTIEPIHENHLIYKKFFDVYKPSYDATERWAKSISGIKNET